MTLIVFLFVYLWVQIVRNCSVAIIFEEALKLLRIAVIWSNSTSVEEIVYGKAYNLKGFVILIFRNSNLSIVSQERNMHE